jgi:flagellar hook-associated protein 2
VGRLFIGGDLMADPTISFGGLASGMDTQSIIDKLVQLESQPITLLQTHESGFKAQVSALGDISSKLAALQTAASNLSTSGALGLKTTSTNTSFSATPGSSAVAGSYDIQVQQIATQTKLLSAAFTTGDTAKGGTLTFGTQPDGTTPSPITIPDGASIQDVASAIRSSGAPVSAVVLNDDLGTHLSVTSLATGSAATVTFQEAVGASGTKSLAFTSTAGVDATFSIDSLPFTRASNTITDALPGTTLQLKSGGGASAPTETLVMENDTDATSANLKQFVDAYNGVMQLVQKQLAVTASTDRASTLAGDPAVRMLQQSLQAIGASVVGAGSVRSLADLGLKTQRDGTLSIDDTTLASAIARNPGAVNTIFSDTSAGISKLTEDLVDEFTGPDGMLVTRQNGLNDQISEMDDEVASMQLRVDTYRKTLVAQFTAMENVVSQYKNIGTFLSQQSSSSSS